MFDCFYYKTERAKFLHKNYSKKNSADLNSGRSCAAKSLICISILNVPESDGSRAVAVRLLDASGGRGGLAGSLGGELLAGGFASSGFACGLLSAGHLNNPRISR